MHPGKIILILLCLFTVLGCSQRTEYHAENIIAQLEEKPVERKRPEPRETNTTEPYTSNTDKSKPQSNIHPKSLEYSSNIDTGTYYAIVIGNDDYIHLPRLKTATNDAKSVHQLLTSEYNFKSKLLLNASRAQILMALNEARKTLTKEDKLLVYYAGHGWLDEQADRGYWIPVDAEQDNNINWISNTSITDAVRAMQAKHVMIVSDSCYSGKLTRGINLSVRQPGYVNRLASKKARTVLTSGGLEPVTDSGGGNHSVFAKAFLEVLRDNQGVLEGHQLLIKIRRPVILNSDQTPEYSDLRKAGHDGGDFLFVRKK